MKNRKVTKQKFYEQLVLKTYLYSKDDVFDEERDRLAQAGFDIREISFDELMVARAALGLNPDLFPDKQPFDKLGFDYFAQVTRFVLGRKNEVLTDMYFSVLAGYPDMVDFSDSQQAEFMYRVYLDMLDKDRDFCRRLGSFIFRHAEGCEWYPNFLSVAYNLVLIDRDVTLVEILEMKKKHPFTGFKNDN